MKCALIIPAWVPEDLFPPKTAGSQVNYWQPLGTLYVASCLLQAGHAVRLFNGAFLTHDEILAGIREYDPGFAGIYSTAFGWPKAKRTAEDIKRLNREIFTCAGGPYPIAAREDCLNRAGESLDAVVTGEGEWSVVEMVETLQSGGGLEGVEGVIFRGGGKIISNPPRPLIADLDSIPYPARELLGDADRYIPPPGTYRRQPVAVMITARGCDRRCIFCFQIDRERKGGIRGVRYRSVENVLKEIELCVQQGYREIKFIDDTFASDYERAMRLAQEIKARRLDVVWFASACVNQVDTPLLRAFKEAGCWAILFGAESGVQKNLNAIRKGITLDQTRKAVKAAKEIGLTVSTPFLFGLPGETFDEGLRTIEFALELDPDLANFHALTPFPGTDLYDQREQYGSVSDDLRDYTYQGAAFVPYTMTRREIVELRQIALRRFYSRPSFLLRRLGGLRSLNDLAVAARGIRSLFWLWAGANLFEGRNGRAAASNGRSRPHTKVFPGEGRVPLRIKEDIRDEIAFVGAVAAAVPNCLLSESGPVRSDESSDVVAEVSDVPEALGTYLAGIHLPGFREDKVQSAGVAGGEPFPGEHGAVDQTVLHDVLSRLDARAPEAVDR